MVNANKSKKRKNRKGKGFKGNAARRLKHARQRTMSAALAPSGLPFRTLGTHRLKYCNSQRFLIFIKLIHPKENYR